MKWSVAVLALAVVGSGASAEPFVMNGTTYEVQDVAGSGGNRALLEIDFGTNASPQAYLFGYEWTGARAPTGRDVLTALQANGNGVSFTDTYFASFDEHLLNTLWYQDNQPADDYPNAFWYYFTSGDTGQSFTISNDGYDATPVVSGDVYAWALQHDDPNEFRDFSLPPLPPSHFPAALVAGAAVAPEPGTLLLAAGGLLAAGLRRRR